MSKPRTYIETSVVSYLTARPSGDVRVAVHQQITQEWWVRRERLDLFVSELVVIEARQGDPIAAAERLKLLQGIPFIEFNPEARELARRFMAEGAVPRGSEADAGHVAVATVHAMTFLVTWNCRHIASAFAMAKLAVVCKAAGLNLPTICTPEQFNDVERTPPDL